MLCWCWYVDGNMIGDGDNKTDKDRSHSSRVIKLFWKNHFFPKNHFCVKWHHQRILCYGRTTTRHHVYAKSNESRSNRCWEITLFPQKRFCPKNHACFKFHQKSSLYLKGETTEQLQIKLDDSRHHSCWVINIFQKSTFIPKITHAWSSISKVDFILKVTQRGIFKPSWVIPGTMAVE